VSLLQRKINELNVGLDASTANDEEEKKERDENSAFDDFDETSNMNFFERMQNEPRANCTTSVSGYGVQVCTVDAFQGEEKEVIILSCCRSEAATGFIDSPNRMNVSDCITSTSKHILV
jgi:hypothetical protein